MGGKCVVGRKGGITMSFVFWGTGVGWGGGGGVVGKTSMSGREEVDGTEVSHLQF